MMMIVTLGVSVSCIFFLHETRFDVVVKVLAEALQQKSFSPELEVLNIEGTLTRIICHNLKINEKCKYSQSQHPGRWLNFIAIYESSYELSY